MSLSRGIVVKKKTVYFGVDRTSRLGAALIATRPPL